MGIIPGNMGARSDIVRGLGNPESFESCSHGAGPLMSRSTPRPRKYSPPKTKPRQPRAWNTAKYAGVIDEIPMAYEDIDAVMAAQSDLMGQK